MENRVEMRDGLAKSIFLDALEIAMPEARAGYLDRRCGSDDRLRAEVEALLRHHERLGDYLEHPACEAVPTQDVAGDPRVEGPGTVIGPYNLMEQIGEGGMGVVYVAEQTKPVRRKVALKIIKPGMDTKQVIARFEAERQALALMDHPNIAKVLDGGATESGPPYFVMELVRGVPITEYCDEQQLSITERLELFVLVCRAVQHAHQKGIIHRDLKPSNILVTLHDGVPVPKVIDFGVAKAIGGGLTEKTIYTAFTQLVGTPLYMSPEQVEMSGLDVDTRSDIYSLGVLLYELLTGTTPFDSETLRKAAFDEMRRMIREDEPPRPSERLSGVGETLTTTSVKRSSGPRRLHRSVRGELDWVVMRALEKDRRRRYETANDFAADVMNFLTDRPVEACPPSAPYRFRKYVRRNQTLLVTVALVAVALLVGAAVSIWQAVRATHAQAEAVLQRVEAQRQKRVVEAREVSLRRYLYAADMKLASQAWSNARNNFDLDQVRRLLARHEPDANREDVRSFAWYYLNGLCGQTPRATLVGHEGKVYHLAISPDGKTLATASEDGTAKLWDLATAQLRHTLRGHADEVNCVAFAPDGQELVTASDDRTVRFWDPISGREHSAQALTGLSMSVHRVDFSADRRLLVTGELSERWDAAATTIWDVSTRGQRLRKEGQFPLALSPDSNTLATTDRDWAVRLWDVVGGQERAILRGHSKAVVTGAFSPDGGTLATGSGDGTVRLWGFNEPQGTKRRSREPEIPIHSVVYSPDGKLLAAGDLSGAVYLWETSRELPAAIFCGHKGRVRAVRFTPDGGTLASSGDDRTVNLWDLTATNRARQPPDQPRRFTALSFSPDDEHLATTIATERSLIWTVRTGEARPLTLHHPDREMMCVAFSPVGRLLATSGAYGSVSLVDPNTGIEHWTTTEFFSTGIRVLVFSPDGGRLVGGGDDGSVHVWDTRTGKALHELKLEQTGYGPAAQSIAISPDGRTLALRTGGVVCWDLATGVPRDPPIRTVGVIGCLAYSPDGRTLATGAEGKPWIQLWDTNTGRERVTLSGGSNHINSLAFSPDGQTLACGGDHGEVRLWDVATGQELISLVGHTGTVHFVTFSHDGNTLATAGDSADGQRGELKFWRAERPTDRASKPNRSSGSSLTDP
jgi:WD40 repeat protein/serine/threonine protein kinase